MVGIIGAMDIEVENLRDTMRGCVSTVVSGITFWQGTIGKTPVVVAKCGIGKVFAAVCAEIMITKFAPDVIINTGVAGSLSADLNIADIVIASAVVQHDMDTSPLGDPVGMISGINIVEIGTDPEWAERLASAADRLGIRHSRGIVASGDQFVADREVKERIISRFGASACEMEGAAIGQVCYINRVPFAVLRSISDSFSGEAGMEYAAFAKTAADNSFRVLTAVL